MGPLGSLTSGRGAFDDRASLQEDFRFHGSKGDQWKQKVERYFFLRVAADYELFSWAEKEEGPIRDERFSEAVSEGLVTLDRDGVATNHLHALNGVISGFLSNAFCRVAETMFKQAGILRGVEAWRRIV